MRVHIIMHESFEAPAAIEQWAKEKGCAISYTRLYMGDQFPDTTDDIDFLVVMGGPQSPATTLEECPHFDAKKEIQFIQSAIYANKKVLGVCLGAQIIGEALGAAFDHSPNREIGVFDITLTEAGKTDPIFSTFPHTFSAGHWHGDMPGHTPESEILAYSEGCPRQVVRYSPNVYGIQCHFEFTPEAIDGMIRNCGHELEQYKSMSYIESEESLRAHDFYDMNKRLFAFLDYLTSTH